MYVGIISQMYDKSHHEWEESDILLGARIVAEYMEKPANWLQGSQLGMGV